MHLSMSDFRRAYEPSTFTIEVKSTVFFPTNYDDIINGNIQPMTIGLLFYLV